MFATLALLSFVATGYPKPELLIEAPVLAKDHQQFRLLDVRPKAEYDAGHLPGAFWINAADWGTTFDKAQDSSDWSSRLGKLRIDHDSRIVVYGGDVRDAARIWWILRYWGIKDVRLLNGGWTSWTGPTNKEVPESGSGILKLVGADNRLETKDELLATVRGKTAQIVDARSEKEYCGEATTAKRNGRVPDAVRLEWTETLDAKSKKFKSADELATLIKDRKIDLDQPVVTYCQGGGRASVVAFSLELMGGRQVRNYYRSWAEWGNAADTPVDTGKK